MRALQPLFTTNKIIIVTAVTYILVLRDVQMSIS
jgi:hypothetical protein